MISTPKKLSQLNHQRVDIVMMLGLDLVIILCIGFSAYYINSVLPLYRRAVELNGAMTPLAMLVREMPYSLYVPLLGVATMAALTLIGKLVKWRTWAVSLALIFSIYVGVATIWILGLSSPFWNIPLHPLDL